MKYLLFISLIIFSFNLYAKQIIIKSENNILYVYDYSRYEKNSDDNYWVYLLCDETTYDCEEFERRTINPNQTNQN